MSRILLAIDDGAASDNAVCSTAELIRSYDDHIAIATVVVPQGTAVAHRHPVIGSMVRGLVNETHIRQEDAAWSLVQRAAAQLCETSAHLEMYVRISHRIAEEVLDLARDWSADLLVIGASPQRGFLSVCRIRVGARLIAQAPCPVLVARPRTVSSMPAADRAATSLRGAIPLAR